MKFLLWSLLYVFIGTLVIYGLAYYSKPDFSKLGDNAFLFNFFGILLGFALTIFTFIVGLVEKIKDKAEIKFVYDNNKVEKVQKHIDILYSEIKDNIWFTFLSLIIIGIIYLFEAKKISLDNPYIVWNKNLFINSIKLSLFALNMYAIYDLIIIAFKLSDTVSVLKKGDD